MRLQPRHATNVQRFQVVLDDFMIVLPMGATAVASVSNVMLSSLLYNHVPVRME